MDESEELKISRNQYIKAMLHQFQSMAVDDDRPVLAYLLEMAYLETEGYEDALLESDSVKNAGNSAA